MENIISTKYSCLAARFSDDELRSAVAVCELHTYFPGSTRDDWISWRNMGLLPLLPGKKKVALTDAIEFWVVNGVAKAIPTQKREDEFERSVLEFERRAIEAGKAFNRTERG